MTTEKHEEKTKQEKKNKAYKGTLVNAECARYVESLRYVLDLDPEFEWKELLDRLKSSGTYSEVVSLLTKFKDQQQSLATGVENSDETIHERPSSLSRLSAVLYQQEKVR
jgi:hypothetical protein